MFYYYLYKNKYLFSIEDKYNYTKVKNIPLHIDELYFLYESDKNASKGSYAVSETTDLFNYEESIELLKLKGSEEIIPENIKQLIDRRKIKAVNTSYENYEERFCFAESKKKTVNILALGDVGSTLLTGLKLLGGDIVEYIGIYDRSPEKIQRFEYEMNQISFPFEYDVLPEVHGISKDELFDCDMFVFCASKGVPPIGDEGKDVRMVQLEENARLIREYVIMAADKDFKGIFAVVSDPVDPLCAVVLKESNNKLLPEQIKGYGLGVMNARAVYYAKKHKEYAMYLDEGRAFGPHGNDLVIANSIINYDDKLSNRLTKLAVEANLQVRKTGFKPYIAPALSSGAISIVYTLEGKWHYSSNYIAGVYMGAKNRNLCSGLEIEKINMPDELFDRIKYTYDNLKKIRDLSFCE
ncbi:lactate dehydrogenase [Sedimentibacter hydroxybenzoicus DSM 7310]|uniref:Lactate dehydrogenase n=1 Tax=Sedimentibacter hydroxybenzoicus DSM 7310 TaxID=1123245 RepID=A0A974GX71_SEDHY|nr:lactate dehydrogenase [Sedimentibacter hydroxybenzoicus DSM 7310]